MIAITKKKKKNKNKTSFLFLHYYFVASFLLLLLLLLSSITDDVNKEGGVLGVRILVAAQDDDDVDDYFDDDGVTSSRSSSYSAHDDEYVDDDDDDDVVDDEDLSGSFSTADSIRRPGTVIDLTPELYKKLLHMNNKGSDLGLNKRSRFFVKINTRKCDLRPVDNVCEIITDNVWYPLAQMYPNEIFAQLDCHIYDDLCYDISSQKYVQVLEGIAPFDLMMIEFMPGNDVITSIGSPCKMSADMHRKSRIRPRRRAVEFYRGVRDLQSSVNYYSEIIQRNEPLLPAILTYDWDDGKGGNNNNYIYNNEKQIHIQKQKRTTQKLIVLVLSTDGGFVRPDIWTQFVTNTTTNIDVQIYIHDTTNNNNNNKINNNGNNNNNIPDFCHIIPTVYTNRITISLVRAVIQLLRYAIHHVSNQNHIDIDDIRNDNDNENTYYILVSGDSIPLLSAQDILNELSSSKDESSSSNKNINKNDNDKDKDKDKDKKMDSKSSSTTRRSRFEKYPDSDADADKNKNKNNNEKQQQQQQQQQHTPYIFRYGINVDNPNIGYGTGDIQMGGGFAQPESNYGYAKVFRSKLWFTMNHNDAKWFANQENDETSNFEMMITSDEYYFATLANEYYNNDQGQNQHGHKHKKQGRGPGQFEQNLPFMYDIDIDININIDNSNPELPSPSTLDYVDDTIYKKSGYLFARKITSETQVVLSWLNNNNNNNNATTISSMTKVDLSLTGQIINEQLVNFQQHKNKTTGIL